MSLAVNTVIMVLVNTLLKYGWEDGFDDDEEGNLLILMIWWPFDCFETN